MNVLEEIKKRNFNIGDIERTDDRQNLLFLRFNQDAECLFVNSLAKKILNFGEECVFGKLTRQLFASNKLVAYKFEKELLKVINEQALRKLEASIHGVYINFIFYPNYQDQNEMSGVLVYGTIHDLELESFPLVGENDKVEEFLSDQTTKLETRGDNKDLFQIVFNEYSEAILVVDDQLQIIFENKKFRKLSGYTCNELRNTKLNSIFQTKRIDWGNLSTNLVSESKPKRIVTWMNTTNGEIYVDVILKMFLFNGSWFGLCTIKDVGSEQRILELLTHYDMDFYNLIEKSPNVYLRFNRKLNCIYVNSAFSDITGHSNFDIININPKQFPVLPQNEAEHLEKMLKKAMDDKELLQGCSAIKHAKTNRQVYFNCNIFPEFDSEGNVRGALIVANDVSKLKEKEEQLREAKIRAEEGIRLKTSFLALVSHEIRTPLNAIVGFSKILEETTNYNDKNRLYLEMVIESGNKLVGLLDELIDLATVESESVAMKPISFELEALFDMLYSDLEELHRQSGKQDIKLKSEGQNHLAKIGTLLYADVNRLQQLINNLFRNAIEFTEKGTISFGVSSDKPNWITFYVTDTGIGIAEENQELIFDSFVQLEDVHSRLHGGLGIGLSSARKIAKSMGGSIKIKSALGKGSTFYFSVPLNFNDWVS